MKIRTDFVTNSSSSSFILEISFLSEDDKKAKIDLAVCPEGADLTADGISLTPDKKNNSVSFSDTPLSSMKNIEDLCDLLCDSAIIEGWIDEDDSFGFDDDDFDDDNDFDDYDDFDDDDDEGKDVSVSEASQKTVKKLKKNIQKSEITLENLKSITIKNMEFGSGDSAMWINYDNEVFRPFKEKYKEVDDKGKKKVVAEMFDFIKSEPVLPVNDHIGRVPAKMVCVWEGNDKSLKNAITEYLSNETDSGDSLIGTYSDEYKIDVKNDTVEPRKVMYFDKI